MWRNTSCSLDFSARLRVRGGGRFHCVVHAVLSTYWSHRERPINLNRLHEKLDPEDHAATPRTRRVRQGSLRITTEKQYYGLSDLAFSAVLCRCA